MSPKQLRDLKAGMFAERPTTDSVLQYVQDCLPKEHQAVGITACMMMFNTVLEQLAQSIEEGEE